jgi:hypothetical protein
LSHTSCTHLTKAPGGWNEECNQLPTSSRSSVKLTPQALLPLRIAISIGAAPAFARFALNPIQRLWRRVVRR